MENTRCQKIVRSCVVTAALGTVTIANATHFRGGSLVPQVDAGGLLTLTGTTFWRPTFVDELGSISVGGASVFRDTISTDTSDSRFTRVTETYSFQLTSPGAVTAISDSSCCRVGGVANANEDFFSLAAGIFWDGSTANNPINFDFISVNPNVPSTGAYSDNLGATPGNSGTLSYNLDLNTSITAPVPGLSLDANGQLSIADASALSHENTFGNVGADYAFSGNILNSDGSFVQFDWVFDANSSLNPNQPPVFQDDVINALVGDVISQQAQATDPEGMPLTFDLISFSGSGGILAAIAPILDGAGQLTWDTAGSPEGTYTLTARVSDGSLTDTGQITINLAQAAAGPSPLPPTNAIPLPSALLLFVLGLIPMSRKRRGRRR